MRSSIRRILLVTDFGDGIYVGQMRARLDELMPRVPVVDLVHDLPPFRADLAAYLLPALARDVPPGTLYICVVDPGVGGERDGLLIHARDSWFIGPDNGLLVPLMRSASGATAARVGWRPQAMSASFHGRDWFVPVAARWSGGADLGLTPVDSADLVGSDWPTELPAVLYVDRFGNLMTGLQAADRPRTGSLLAGARTLPYARTFCEVARGNGFWYENALGLVEIAVNQGRADRALGLSPGDPVGPFLPPD